MLPGATQGYQNHSLAGEGGSNPQTGGGYQRKPSEGEKLCETGEKGVNQSLKATADKESDGNENQRDIKVSDHVGDFLVTGWGVGRVLCKRFLEKSCDGKGEEKISSGDGKRISREILLKERDAASESLFLSHPEGL